MKEDVSPRSRSSRHAEVARACHLRALAEIQDDAHPATVWYQRSCEKTLLEQVLRRDHTQIPTPAEVISEEGFEILETLDWRLFVGQPSVAHAAGRGRPLANEREPER